jgi:hypothetical protein
MKIKDYKTKWVWKWKMEYSSRIKFHDKYKKYTIVFKCKLIYV